MTQSIFLRFTVVVQYRSLIILVAGSDTVQVIQQFHVGNETSDSLTGCLNVMYTIVDETNDEKLKTRTVDVVEATLDQNLREDAYAALVADPRSVHAVGVIDPKAHIRKELAKAMADYTESPTFRKLLDLDKDHELACKCISQAGIFDVNVLESVGSCLPATVKASLLDRATKSEILVKLVNFRKRQEISKRMREDNRRYCNRLLRLEIKPSGVSTEHARDSVIVMPLYPSRF